MYESPINLIHGQVQIELEGTIWKAIQDVMVDVDKEELVKALEYDRGQYEKGYADALKTIVRCKDCKYRHTEDCSMQHTVFSEDVDANPEGIRVEWTDDNGFCSWGERKIEDG